MPGNERSGRGGKAADRNPIQQEANEFSFDCPAWLNKLGMEYWERNAPRLIDCGVLTNKDYDAFCKLCDIYADWRDCQAKIKKSGLFYKTTSDRGAMRIVEHPAVARKSAAFKDMMNLERKFGLTPIDGKGMKFKKDEKKKSVRDKY